MTAGAPVASWRTWRATPAANVRMRITRTRPLPEPMSRALTARVAMRTRSSRTSRTLPVVEWRHAEHHARADHAALQVGERVLDGTRSCRYRCRGP